MKLIHNGESIKLSNQLPVIPLRDVVVFPHMIYPLLIGRSFTVNALNAAMDSSKQVLLVAQRDGSQELPKSADLYDVGTVARVLQVMKMPNGTMKVLIEGLVRAKVVDFNADGEFTMADVDIAPLDLPEESPEIEAKSRSVLEQFSEYVRLNRRMPDEVLVALSTIDKYHQRVDTIAAHMLLKLDTKQELLEANSVDEAYNILAHILKEEIEILQIELKIDGTVRESMSRNQREFYLQQQLKAIKDELEE